MIKLQIIGNLGADCIQKEVNGKPVINFNVAHTEKFKDAQGNQKERTTWVNCAYWTERTAVAQYLMKGKMVFVEGSPEAESYTNKDGQQTATLRMRVQNLQLLGGNTDGQQSNQGYASSNAGNSYNSGNATNTGNTYQPAVKTQSQPAGVANMPLDDDLPF